MINDISRKFSLFYQVCFGLVLMATASSVIYFWSQGFINGKITSDLHKVNYILEEIETKKPLKQIRSFVLRENHKLALEKVDQLEGHLKDIDQVVDDSDFKYVQQDLSKMKSSIASMISFSKTQKVLGIFNSKLNNFYNYVSQKKWMTLTRSSKRILSISQGYISSKNLKGVTSKIFKNIDLMKKISKTSVLKRAEKLDINSRLAGLEVELKMLNRYVEKRNISLNIIKLYQQTMFGWIAKVSPTLTEKRVHSEQAGKYFVLCLLFIFALSLVLFVGSFSYFKFARKRAQSQLEEFLEQYVDKSLLLGEDKLIEGRFNSEFIKHTEKMSEYIQKRMSLGSIFQEGLPFSGLLLDKNLKVLWANKSFMKDWKLDSKELGSDYLSWDYLSKMTSIGDEDPVVKALQRGKSSVTQIQLQKSEDEDARHLEMFISPVEYNGKSYLSLYFYSLDGFEESIQEQAYGVIQPVQNMFKAVLENRFKGKVKLEIEQEFKKQKIHYAFHDFVNILDQQEGLRDKLLTEIEILNSKITGFESLHEELQTTISESFLENSEIKQGLKLFKSHIIDLISKVQSLQYRAESDVSKLEETYNHYSQINSIRKNLNSDLETALTLMKKMNKRKESFKLLKSEMSELNSKLSFSISDFVHIKNNLPENLKDKFASAYDKLNLSFTQLSECWSASQKLILELDIAMVKNDQFINESISLARCNDYEVDLSFVPSIVEQSTVEIEDFKRSFNLHEDSLISGLKQSYHAQGKQQKNLKLLESITFKKPIYDGFLASNNNDLNQDSIKTTEI